MSDLGTGGGSHFNSDGERVNVVDIAIGMDKANLLVAVTKGRVYQAAYRDEIPAGDTFYFHQPVTSGFIRGVSLSIVISGGPIDYDLLAGATPGNVVKTIQGYNADRRLIGTPDFTSSIPINRVDGLTGGTVVDMSFGQTPDTGANKSSSGLTAAGVGGFYDTASAPGFKMANTGNGPARVKVALLWEEFD